MSPTISQIGPLAGLRVLDLTQMLAGPICGMRLADLGADVIKVEPTEGGEWTRTHGFANAEIDGETTAFLGLNRNKKSVALNLKTPGGLEAFYELVKKSDILIENYRRGTANRLGVGYAKLSEINPRLIYGSISGYGESGPYRDRPGQDLLVQAMSGSMWSVGRRTDPPMPGALWAVDAMTGYQLAIGLLSAVLARQELGRGQQVMVSMLGVVMDCQCQELVTAFNLGKLPERSDKPFAHAWVTAPYAAYQTQDGWMVISQVPLDTLGEALDDDRLRKMTQWSDGMDHRDEVYEIVKSILPGKTTAEWVKILDEYKLWGGKVYNYQELMDDPHVRETGMIASVQHAKVGEIKMPNIPIKFSATPGGIRMAPPSLGEHTENILVELAGYNQEKIQELRMTNSIR
jgi:crotonobetainyl-CoA:carnitine CoA-transferase CaiB-like acyl-CoA transferase